MPRSLTLKMKMKVKVKEKKNETCVIQLEMFDLLFSDF